MLLCDDVERPADAPSKVNIVGLVHAINIPDEAEFPIIIDQLTIYLAVTGGRGPARLQIVGAYADTEEVAFQNPERSVDFGTDPLLVHGLTFRVRAIPIYHPGLYLIQVRCNGHVIAHQPLLVR
jgi:hypothetical protein